MAELMLIVELVARMSVSTPYVQIKAVVPPIATLEKKIANSPWKNIPKTLGQHFLRPLAPDTKRALKKTTTEAKKKSAATAKRSAPRKSRRPLSESIGHPTRGKLQNARPIVDGTGRGVGFIFNTRRKARFATAETVKAVQRCMSVYRGRFPKNKYPPITIGDLSLLNGGALPPHRSHQSGRDVDIGYALNPGQTPGFFDKVATKKNLDLHRQWVIIKCFLDNPQTHMIFIHATVVDALRIYIKRIYKGKRAHLVRKYLDYFPEGKKRVLRSDYEHTTHMHVRFHCPKTSKKCVE